MNFTSGKIVESIEANDLKLMSSHRALSLPIIRRLYLKMLHGIKFDHIKVCEDLVIDGHHRYVAAVLSGVKIDSVPSQKTSATRRYEWKNVNFLNDEWDTAEKIALMNASDAEFNHLSIEEIENIIKQLPLRHAAVPRHRWCDGSR